MTGATSGDQPGLARGLGLTDAVVIGLGAMLGAGIFSALAPAAAAGGWALLIGLAVAAVVAFCNATSSARLAARYPSSGGTYVYGRERLGPFWGYLAGWSFVVGKTASCAAMALTVGSYVWPAHQKVVAVSVVVLVTAVSWAGVQKAAWLTRVIVGVVVVVLAAVVAVCLGSPAADLHRLGAGGGGSVRGTLEAAGLLFFAFAGYARIATLGEEVRDPGRTIRLAIPTALGVTLVIYSAVALATLSVLGPAGLASAVDPLAAAVTVAGAPALATVVRIGAAVAAIGALLALALGVSRTVLAMARDHHLPARLAIVQPGAGVPRHAELAVGVVVAVLAVTVDLQGAIGFSSFGVLVYYAIANASAWTLRHDRPRPLGLVPAVGLVGCVLLCVSLPIAAAISGASVVAAGAAVYGIGRAVRRRPNPRNG